MDLKDWNQKLRSMALKSYSERGKTLLGNSIVSTCHKGLFLRYFHFTRDFFFGVAFAGVAFVGFVPFGFADFGCEVVG